MSPAKTSAERQRDYRARKAKQQLTEVRGIYAPPADHVPIRAAAMKAAKKLERQRAKSPTPPAQSAPIERG